jgi:hypothetical protein
MKSTSATHTYNESIVELDGAVPHDMKDFVRRIEANKAVVRMRTSRGGIIAFDCEQAAARQALILERYHIPKDRSRTLENL